MSASAEDWVEAYNKGFDDAEQAAKEWLESAIVNGELIRPSSLCGRTKQAAFSVGKLAEALDEKRVP